MDLEIRRQPTYLTPCECARHFADDLLEVRARLNTLDQTHSLSLSSSSSEQRDLSLDVPVGLVYASLFAIDHFRAVFTFQPLSVLRHRRRNRLPLLDEEL